jgi:hypothetical protein
VPRFGVRQGDKLRPIDDGSVGRNSAYSSGKTFEIPVVGNIEDYSQASARDIVIIRARADRIEGVRAEIVSLLQN